MLLVSCQKNLGCDKDRSILFKRFMVLSQVMLVGSRAKLLNISTGDGIRSNFVIEGEVVPMVNEAQYLGIQIDKTLSWKEHINIIAPKISRGIGMLRYAKRYAPLSTMKTMYGSIVEPYLRYCCTV